MKKELILAYVKELGLFNEKLLSSAYEFRHWGNKQFTGRFKKRKEWFVNYSWRQYQKVNMYLRLKQKIIGSRYCQLHSKLENSSI